MYILYFFSIPVWIFLIIVLAALGIWELLGSYINILICAFILLMIAFTILHIILGIVDLFIGSEKGPLVLDGDYLKGLVGGIAVSLLGGSLMYDTYISPYVVKETGYELVLNEPEKEIKAVGELTKIAGTKKCSAFYVNTASQYENYVHCTGKRGEITLYSGNNYKYMSAITEDVEGCEIYADGEVITPQYDGNIQMFVYDIDNCSELKFKFSEAMELSETWLYKTTYPTL